MDDLAGLSWSASSTQQSKSPNPPAPSNANYFPTLKPTPPTSGRSTPAPTGKPGSSSTGASKAGTPANDSFASLLPFNASQPAKQVSLQEQQKALQEQRAKTLGFQSQQWTGGSGQGNAGAGSGQSTPARALSPALSGAVTSLGGSKPAASKPGSTLAPPPKQGMKMEDEEDILAAFNSSAPVDRSTHFPPPALSRTSSTDPARASSKPPVANSDSFAGLDDDDPFGLGTGPSKSQASTSRGKTDAPDDDDDVLGLLGKPVSELPRRPKSPEARPKAQDPRDKAIAELVDMGFPAEKAAKALATTESGTDVQGAVGWLLNQAHADSTGKPSRGGAREVRDRPTPSRGDSDTDGSGPAWMRQSRSSSNQRSADGRAEVNGEERDPAKMASELGSNLFKTANSLWKTGQKRFNKAVADFNTEGGDASQPKWMRDPQGAPQEEASARRPNRKNSAQSGAPSTGKKAPSDLVDMTDEAMMLESGGGRSQGRAKAPQSKTDDRSPSNASRRTTESPGPPTQPPRPNRRFVEEESAQAYVSPARRKKPTPKPPPPQEEPDLLFGGSSAPTRAASSMASTKTSASRQTPASAPRPKRSVTPPRPKAPPRNVPPLSSIALKSSTSHRLKGNDAFKLGNYGEATSSYSNSLRDIPNNHPLTILLLTNRALTNLKTGDPKAAIADAEAAIEVIGPSRGQHETIDVGGDEGSKPMAPFWGKAMMRRAEALEQLERWADAGKAWGECVQAGVGGSQAIQARTRCESALAPKPRPTPAAKKPPPPKPKPRSAMDDLSGRPSAATASSAEAVTRLRAANAAAEKADDEKFALADSVDARLTNWRKGKEGNLRALLGSLDTVLWEGANWKKVGMSELIVPGKVKIAYMKGIAKVHPDKLQQGASTEQVMISGAVFATLNEAWDTFKAQNGL